MFQMEPDPLRVLLVEDEEPLGEGIAEVLRNTGHQVEWVTDGLTAQAALLAGGFDVAVLDLRLPGRDGVDVLRHARSEGVETPVLILTARDTVDDRITGLDAGADDYLVKPFDLGELRARLRALQRRASGRLQQAIEVGEVRLDPSSREVARAGQPVQVTPSEFELLQLLLENCGRIVSRRSILERLHGADAEPGSSDTIKVYVHSLRRKLGAEFIRTVRGVGYMVEEPA